MRFKAFACFVSLLAVAGCASTTAPVNTATGSKPSPTPTPAANSLTVTSPAASASVSSPFIVSATATDCQSQAVSSIGYSIDQGSANQVEGTILDTQALANAGQHTVHVVAWAADGSSCNTDVSITVNSSSSPATGGPAVPANAVTVSEIQQLPNWRGEFDTGTGAGTSQGVMSLTSSPSLSGSALEMQTQFTNNGGERYHVSFGSDPLATHFVYDAWVYLASPSDSISNLELDMNQVLANGQTVIYGFQCDGYSNTWDFTRNAGTPDVPNGKWVHSSAACNVNNWSTDNWHHIQIGFSRDDAGNATYETVWLDGAAQSINQTVPAAYALGWAQVLLTNFQIDGRGASGSNTVYVDHLSISRW
jgi:hypothetical protein